MNAPTERTEPGTATAARIESQAEPVPGYRLLDRLGSGGFGEVWRAQAPGGIFKAIKVIHGDLRNRDTDSHRFAEQELKALKRVQQVRHPYLLTIDRYDIVDGRLMIVMELADCNLWDRFRVCRKAGLQGIPREELLRYMSETAEVLDLFDEKFQLQHLDIKPQNLFLLHDHVKVADFGQVKDLENHMAEVTGGITPVYAAPETFDGFVSRYCDQYSLACVYQELLTGVRPFDGTSMQQLLMQHLQMAPNLAPTPAAERAALARALSKQPNERFPNVRAMVEAIRNGSPPARTSQPTPPSGVQSLAARPGPPVPEDQSPSGRIEVSLTGSPGLAGTDLPGHLGGLVPATYAPSSRAADSFAAALFPRESTPFPPGLVETAAPPDREAPADVSGPGCLRPALVVGLGHTGRLVLQRLRKQVGDRFGTPDKVPTLRTVYIDTDPDALAAATARPAAGYGALAPDDVVPAKLARAAHYLRPRVNGRTLLDGWFDPSWLYKLPRNPVTLGLRAFGRLAFVDHHRAIAHKVAAELGAATDPQAMADARAHTGLDLATNRPRVYVVAGLGGGTGGGMLIDVAYAVRQQLRKLGYADADLVGLLLAPPDAAPGGVSPQAQANTYAALTELHHYARPEAEFRAVYDERVAPVRDGAAPFARVVLVPGLAYPVPVPGSASGVTSTSAPRPSFTPTGIGAPSPRNSGLTRLSGTTRLAATRRSGVQGVEADRVPPARAADDTLPDAVADAADFLRLQLFTPAGPLLDEVRPPATDAAHGSFVQTYGLTRFGWPRAEVVGRVARILSTVLVNHWVSPDAAHVRQTIPAWAQDQWARHGLELDALAGGLLRDAEAATGVDLAQVIALGTGQLQPQGWLARTPDAARTGAVVDQWVNLLGRPNLVAGRGTILPAALADAADRRVELALAEFTGLFPNLIEAPQFRLAGTEETIRQVLGLLDRARQRADKEAAAADGQAAAAIDLLAGHANSDRGTRKLGAAELADALRDFPRAQARGLQLKAATRVYRKLRDVLVALLAEVAGCRQRLEAGVPELGVEAEAAADAALPGEFLPAGCDGTEEAAQHFLKSLTDDDFTDLDLRVQEGLERNFGGLYQACLNSTEGHAGVFKVLREQTRAYLESRLGEVDFAGMLFAHFGGPSHAAAGLASAYESARPGLVGNGPWSAGAVNLYVGPPGAGGDPVREVAAEVLPDGTIDAAAPDEVLIYREYTEVPLGAIPQLGALWVNAYKNFADQYQLPPHARLDVTQWTDVDAL